jgi:hypothetical protein
MGYERFIQVGEGGKKNVNNVNNMKQVIDLLTKFRVNSESPTYNVIV